MGLSAWRSLAGFGATVACVIALAGVCTATASAAAEVKAFELDRSTAQAGGHPNIHMKLEFNTKEQEIGEALEDPTKTFNECYCTDPKQFTVHFPTGFIGNPHAVPKCTLAQLGLKKCPPDSQVGIASALFGQQFVYNMEPRPGEPGLLASQLPFLGSPIFNIIRARTDSDYGLDVTTPDIFHLLGLRQLQLWIWGVPTDPANDKYRAPLGLEAGCFVSYPEPCYSTPTPATAPPAPYLQNPTSCEGALTASVDAIYYDRETAHGETSWAATTGCDLLQFSPAMVAQPTTHEADTPSGMDLILRVPQTQSPTVPSPSEVRSLKVTLPKGFAINPNAADGKTACSDSVSAVGTLEAANCPQTSKIGTLTINSSALPGPISGAMYLGEPKPGDRYRVLLAADGYETHVKLVGSAHLDPESGQITVRFDELPQTPLQEFDLHIFGAERGLLATPERCGEYTVESEFVPWAAELGAQITPSSFTINSGPDGTPCPAASRPLDPKLTGGSPDNTAGSFSPFAVKIDRRDGDQTMAAVKVITPPGFLASLKGIPYCPEQAIRKLSDPSYAGRTEQSSPACPAASQVGVATTGTGAGSRPLYTSGRVYFAGPYRGAPLSLVVVIPAVSGPYDLGNVAVRVATFVDPATAQVTTVSDPLPRILDGIPLRLRTVLVNLNRPDFTLNPTNCSPFSIDATLFGDEGAQAGMQAFYEVANCGVLPFGPALSLSLTGGVKRRGHPAIHAVLTAHPGESNVHSIQVTLPRGELLDNSHLGSVCTNVEFASGSCPASSLIGQAELVTPLLDSPLRGSVYLRASTHKLPDLVMDLRGQIPIELAGRVDAVEGGRLRTSFETVPDAPFSKFVLNLQGGSKGLVQNSESLCGRVTSAKTEIVGQSGTELATKTRLKAACTARARHKSKHRARKAG